MKKIFKWDAENKEKTPKMVNGMYIRKKIKDMAIGDCFEEDGELEQVADINVDENGCKLVYTRTVDTTE